MGSVIGGIVCASAINPGSHDKGERGARRGDGAVGEDEAAADQIGGRVDSAAHGQREGAGPSDNRGGSRDIGDSVIQLNGVGSSGRNAEDRIQGTDARSCGHAQRSRAGGGIGKRQALGSVSIGNDSGRDRGAGKSVDRASQLSECVDGGGNRNRPCRDAAHFDGDDLALREEFAGWNSSGVDHTAGTHRVRVDAD